MPFVQRVVQPVSLAQVCSTSGSGNRTNKFLCIPGKCQNNNCINNKPPPSTPKSSSSPSSSQQQQLPRELALNVRVEGEHETLAALSNGDVLSGKTATPTSNSFKDAMKSPSLTSSTTASSTTTVTTAIIHTNGIDGNKDTTDHHHNGFASSFSYNTDHEDDTGVMMPSLSPAPSMPMKKLKQHVDFLSTVPSPTRSHASRSSTVGGIGSHNTMRSSSSHQRLRSPTPTPQSPTAAKIVAGYEFDSISNITLSNALRQLASLVLIASDIFDDLQQELQMVGDRARVVQKKILTVERRVSAYDPKMVTVPESDLLTFAQRKLHYESDKSHRQELFTADSRPQSVRALYEEAGKVTPPPAPAPSSTTTTGSPTTAFASGHHHQHGLAGDGNDASSLAMDGGGGGGGGGGFSASGTNHLTAGSDEFLCPFGVANRKMRKRIDAEIEIRLPAAIEDLRKWTSSEALGDVTVTPDCMHHVDTSISTSMVIGDNGILTPALSPSVLSADAVDALYAMDANHTLIDNSHIPNDINKDVPLNHRLPSPEEQCKIIALRYPAEVISVDTSGKRFQRMCMARKSTTGVFTHMPDTNNLNDDVQTVSRRSRSRKARGKRRNTIAGIDQKEIQNAANGDTTAASGELKNALASTVDGNGDIVTVEPRSHSETKAASKSRFGRSKSSDILKKESVALPYDKGKNTLTRLNSLKQWGRNRFKFMQRNAAGSGTTTSGDQHHNTSTLSTIDSSGCSNDLNSSGSSAHNSSTEKAEICSASGSASGSSQKTSSTAKISGEKSVTDIDDDCRVHDFVTQRAHESRFSHERKPSYSSSEKSMSVSSSGHLRGKLHLNSVCANVKLRDTSSLNRQRRINNLGGNKDDQPHSSSGNWSASSESGRASIGSEITLQPKSSASNTSLNVSTFHNGSSNPPSSMLSRRRFFNTSASSSVTSEGTATPDLQMAHEGGYPNHLDDETSSAYSCDTEGYYTSFHMDSGLRTLKEEEINMSNFQIGGQPLNSSLFGQQQSSFNSSPQTLMAENEYELFGRGSTSTTTSSAGTVCTTLLAHNSGAEQSSLNNSLASCGPEVPERVSSLRHSSASTSTLERSISSSTIGSTLERTGTIKRNVNASLKLSCNEVVCDDNLLDSTDTPESQEGEFLYNEPIKRRGALPLPCSTEVEFSECSDLEGVERIERIKQKTALNAKRIPSMCIITPSTSDDENHCDARSKTLTREERDSHKLDENGDNDDDDEDDDDDDNEDVLNKTLTEESFKDVEQAIGTEEKLSLHEVDNNLNHVKTPTSFSFMDKLRVVLPSVKKSPTKAFPLPELSVVSDDKLYDMAGEYVYISADMSNNNKKALMGQPAAVSAAPVSSSLGIYYSNQEMKRPQAQTEYVSLNELPKTIQKAYVKESPCTPPAVKRLLFMEGSLLSERAGIEGEQRNPLCADSETHKATIHKRPMAATTTSTTAAAAAMATATTTTQHVPMYAEINELRSEIAASAASSSSANALSYLQNTPPSSASTSPHVSPHKGARVRLNAQGKPIYDSDSLKRRKGAHTTFAPGPYVKQQRDEANDGGGHYDIQKENESIDTTLRTSATATATTPDTPVKSESVNPIAKLLLLNKSNANPRKIANVRPIINKSQLTRPLPLTPVEQQNHNNTATKDMSGSYLTSSYAVYSDAKQLTANQTNPYFHPQSNMHSPSTKSTASSAGSTISSTASSTSSCTLSSSSSATTHHSAGSSTAKDDEGYQHLYKRPDEVDSMIQPYYETLSQQQQQLQSPGGPSFQRNAPVYWTLQNRKPQKQQQQMQANALSRDDLYATPLKRSERLARAQQQQQQQQQQQPQQHVPNQQQQLDQLATNVYLSSPGSVRNRSAFLTSTPIRGSISMSGNLDSQLPADNIPAKQRLKNWDDNSPERLNTCADRIGQSKTSLMDFKRLLLAKSAKTSTIPKKVSAVELLKKNSNSLQSPLKANPGGGGPSSSAMNIINNPANSQLNSSMKLLDLSGSPKTFANRRMLRQGQFGSPSKSFAPKMKNNRSNSVQRTDIMSTTIPEANSEEDHSNSSKNSEEENRAHSNESLNLKRNIFLQTEENNFMRGELRSSFGRSKPMEGGKQQPMINTVQPLMKNKINPLSDATNYAGTVSALTTMMASASMSVSSNSGALSPGSMGGSSSLASSTASIANMPALETAL